MWAQALSDKLLAHQLAFQVTASSVSGTSGTTVLPPSAIAQGGLAVPAVLAFLLIAFGMLAAVFFLLHANLPYSRWMNGLWYGLSFGGLWYMGVLESTLVLGTPLEHELVMGFADALPILIMGMLLGALVGTTQSARVRNAGGRVIAIPYIAFCYSVGRYIAYIGLRIDSGITVNPLGTFLWTLGMGMWIGIMYWLLEPGLKGTSAIKRAVVFGGVVYGSDWFMFNFFLPLLYKMNLADLFLRVVVDVLFVMIGVFAAEKLIARHDLTSTSNEIQMSDKNRAA
jgi:hypothetical protein